MVKILAKMVDFEAGVKEKESYGWYKTNKHSFISLFPGQPG